MSKSTMINDNDTNVELEFLRYRNEQVAIRGIEHESGEIWCNYTVCIPSANILTDETILDTNNCPNALKLLEDAKIVKDTGIKVKSGFCSYPVVKLLQYRFLV